ncbi:MAG: tRNA (cytidine(34)-2'-O)-methyltransferase [Magnetospiraceae bacterium]
MRIALYQPDIPQNAGALLRLGACMGVPVDIIEPCGFVLDDRRLRRAGMDYIDQVSLTRHQSWEAFMQGPAPQVGRVILLSARGTHPHLLFPFSGDDVLLVGRESAGVPDHVRAMVDDSVRIPMMPGTRSLNVALSAAMVLAEALRQTGQFPGDLSDTA